MLAVTGLARSVRPGPNLFDLDSQRSNATARHSPEFRAVPATSPEFVNVRARTVTASYGIVLRIITGF